MACVCDPKLLAYRTSSPKADDCMQFRDLLGDFKDLGHPCNLKHLKLEKHQQLPTVKYPASISCKGCNRCLNLSDEYLYPPNAYFDAGNRGTLSFSAVDKTEFRQKEQNQCFPFFETVDYWGIQRRRTTLMCAACGKRLGYIYYDGPYADAGIGQGGFGHTQMIPRHPRYRLKRDAILISG